MQVVIGFSNSKLEKLRTKLAGVADAAPKLAEALNQAGAQLRAHTVVAETRQTGLAADVIDRAQQPHPASAGLLAYTIVAHGGSVRLKYFGAKESGGGVTAHPWGKDEFFAGSFMTSGRPRYLSEKLNGQAFTPIAGAIARRNDKSKAGREHKGRSLGNWYRKIQVERPGLFIPTELTRGETAAAFETGAAQALEAVALRFFTSITG